MRCIELCLSTEPINVLLANVDVAIQHNVSRLELCGAMNLDGLTPDFAAVKQVCDVVGSRIEVLAMLRPNANSFTYQSVEIENMLDDINQFAELGVDGVVFGAIEKNSLSIDLTSTQKIANRCQSLKLKTTFHRAFDVLIDPLLGIEQLISLGVDRVLTSGTPWQSHLTAIDGLQNLANIINAAQGKLEIVIGGGVSSENAATLMELGHLSKNHISLHAYSSVLNGQYLDVEKVKALVNGL